MFSVLVKLAEPTPVEQIKRLRSTGETLESIARATNTTVAVVRGIVGKVDPKAKQAERERLVTTAKRINALPLTYDEKAKQFKTETGKCSVTFWRLAKT